MFDIQDLGEYQKRVQKMSNLIQKSKEKKRIERETITKWYDWQKTKKKMDVGLSNQNSFC